MAKNTKRFKKALEVMPQGPVSVADAVAAIKNCPAVKFNQTVELVIHTGIDPRQADQALRGSISLPHGIGVSRKVIAFCEVGDVEKAKAAGAIEAGDEDLIKKVQGGWMDFDVAVATPAMMKNVSKLGRVLGPQGKMPSPKAGTVSVDIESAIKEYAAGKVEYRNDDGGNLHVSVGKVSFENQQLVDNIEAFVALVKKIKPSTTRGIYIKKACISATMSPSVQLEIQ